MREADFLSMIFRENVKCYTIEIQKWASLLKDAMYPWILKLYVRNSKFLQM